MKLIICEKPSLAKTVANAIGIVENKTDGYFQCKNDYIVTFAFGHLLILKDVAEYENMEKFKWNDLKEPFFPNFEYKIKNDAGVKKQLKIIKKLITDNKNNLESIINCGDADREGQLIIDNILEYVNYNGKVERLWLPEQTADTIKKELTRMKNNKEYINLNFEGKARNYMDWLLGINLTIFLSNKRGDTLHVGRVLIPILKYICDRDIEIEKFVPTPYFQIENTKNIKLTHKKKFNLEDKEKAIAKANELNKNKAIVEDIISKEVKKFPSKLFSLSLLQSTLSKKYKMNFKNSLDIIQKLYEKGYITYPRTNTEYLSENEKDKVKNILKVIGYSDLEFKDSKKIFDTNKVESHSAITPTTKIPDSDLNKEEKKVYDVVFNRFISNFVKEDTILDERTMIIKIAGEEFKIKGSSIKQIGFYKYEPVNIKDEIPNYQKGSEFEVEFKIVEKQTKPPLKITESNLSNYLKNPFKKQKLEDEENVDVEENVYENDDEEYKDILAGVEIGTEATRTGIIENAKKREYITQDKDKYSITDKGRKLIEILNKLDINLYADKSVEFSKALKQVYKGEKTIEDCLSDVRDELNRIFNTKTEIEKVKNQKKNYGEVVGKCFCCGGEVILATSKENKKYYACENKDFFMWENYKYFTQTLKISKSNMKKLLEKQKVPFKLKSKAGKDYEAYMVLDKNGKYINLKQDGFVNKK